LLTNHTSERCCCCCEHGNATGGANQISALGITCISAVSFYVFIAVICEACSYFIGEGVVYDMKNCISEQEAYEKLYLIFKSVPSLQFTLTYTSEQKNGSSSFSIVQKFEHIRDNRCVGN
jgi:hypothetical protein